jgi:hypothetical protein
VTDRKILQENSLFGYEPKSLPYLLCQMNLLLHGLDAPKIDSGNALRFKLSEIGEKDRFEVILTNPPFGGEEEKGVQGNFPEDKQTRGSAAVSPTNHAASSSTADAGGTPRPSRCCCPERDSATCIRWWGHPGQTGERIETDQAWRVSASELLINNCNLDRKNPRAKEDITHLPPEQLLESIWQKEQRIAEIIGKIKPPPLQEERRAVARIEELAGKIGSAQAFRKAAVAEAESLPMALAHRLDLTDFQKRKTGWTKSALGDYISLANNAHRVEVDRHYPNLGIYSFGRGLFQKPPIDGALTAATTLYRVSSGQFICSRLFAFEGAYGMITNDFDGCFVSNDIQPSTAMLISFGPNFFGHISKLRQYGGPWQQEAKDWVIGDNV